MYYKFVDEIPVIQNPDVNFIDGLLTSYVCGQNGCVYLPNITNVKEQIYSWKDEVGYYHNNNVAIFDFYSFSSQLTYYPDNEEMLLLYNKNNDPIEIEILNSVLCFKKEDFDLVDHTYDNLWTNISTPYTENRYYKKHITMAHNIADEDKGKYRPSRFNKQYTSKVVPRHPLNTKDNKNKDNVYGAFLPYHLPNIFLRFAKDITEDSDIINGTIKSSMLNNKKTIVLEHNHILILDQLTTQFRIKSGRTNDLTIFPLWYKTKVRKNFNYSL